MTSESFPSLQRSPERLVRGVLAADRRVLLFGAPGIGKSTYARELARALEGVPVEWRISRCDSEHHSYLTEHV